MVLSSWERDMLVSESDRFRDDHARSLGPRWGFCLILMLQRHDDDVADKWLRVIEVDGVRVCDGRFCFCP